MNDQELYDLFGHGFCILGFLLALIAAVIFIAYDHVNAKTLMITSGYTVWCGVGLYALSEFINIFI